MAIVAKKGDYHPPAILTDLLSIQNITIVGNRNSSRNSIYCPEQEWDKSFCKFQLTPLILPSELSREKEASMKFQQSHKSAMVAFYLNLRNNNTCCARRRRIVAGRTGCEWTETSGWRTRHPLVCQFAADLRPVNISDRVISDFLCICTNNLWTLWKIALFEDLYRLPLFNPPFWHHVKEASVEQERCNLCWRRVNNKWWQLLCEK